MHRRFRGSHKPFTFNHTPFTFGRRFRQYAVAPHYLLAADNGRSRLARRVATAVGQRDLSACDAVKPRRFGIMKLWE